MSKSLSIVSLAALALVASNASATYLANGGFELGTGSDATGWQEVAVAPQRVVDPANARSGEAYMRLFVDSPNASVALQNSVADGGLPDLLGGEVLTLTIWAKGAVGDTGNVNYSLRYLNSGGGILYNSGPQFLNGLNSSYQAYTFNAPAVPAGANAAFLEIVGASGPTDPSRPLNVSIDDVSLVGIPEPTTLGLASIGMLGLARRRRA